MIESEYIIKTRDGLNITGELYSKDSKSVVIFVHGLCSIYSQMTIPYFIRKYFLDNNVDVYLFNLYSDDNVRHLGKECTFKRNEEDFEDVVNALSEKYENLYAIGHSFGATLLMKNNNIKLKAQVCLDTSTCSKRGVKDDTFRKDDLVLCDYLGMYHCISSEKMWDFWLNTYEEDVAVYAKNLTVPTFEINCEKSGTNGKIFENVMPSYCKYEAWNIGHCFEELGSCERMVEESYKWFMNCENKNE